MMPVQFSGSMTRTYQFDPAQVSLKERKELVKDIVDKAAGLTKLARKPAKLEARSMSDHLVLQAYMLCQRSWNPLTKHAPELLAAALHNKTTGETHLEVINNDRHNQAVAKVFDLEPVGLLPYSALQEGALHVTIAPHATSINSVDDFKAAMDAAAERIKSKLVENH